MSECKISNCAFYTCCYGKKKTNGCWVWTMRGNGLFPTFLILYIYPRLFSENNK